MEKPQILLLSYRQACVLGACWTEQAGLYYAWRWRKGSLKRLPSGSAFSNLTKQEISVWNSALTESSWGLSCYTAGSQASPAPSLRRAHSHPGGSPATQQEARPLLLLLSGGHTFECRSFAEWQRGKESTCQAGDTGSITGWRRSPGEGNGNPPQYSCLRNATVRGAWRVTVHWVTKKVGHNLVTKEWRASC